MRKFLSLMMVTVLVILTVMPGSAAPDGDIVLPGQDLAITGVEVTQGTQDLDNSMKLIRKRRTIVRVYVRNNSGTNVNNIRARLRGRVVDANGNVLQDLGFIYANNNPITVRADGGNRLNLNQSFWFYLPYSWRSQTRLRLNAEINYNNAVTDPSSTNNFAQGTVVFYNADPLNLLMVPLHTHVGANDNNPTNTYYCGNACKNIYQQVLRYHPISTINAWKFNSALTPIGHVFGKEWNPSNKSHRSAMLDRIGWKRLWTNDPAAKTHYYGMINPSWGNFGIARRPGYVGLGTMSNQQGPVSTWFSYGASIMAHELGHNKGLLHVNCNGNEAGGGAVDNSYPWPNPNCSLSTVSSSGFYGTDTYYGAFGLNSPTIISNNPNQAAPNRGFPMMGYQSAQWISPWEYCKLMPDYGNSCSWPVANKSEAAPQATVRAQEINAIEQAYRGAPSYLMISGVINDTTGEVELNSFYQRSDIDPARIQETIDLRIKELAMRDERNHKHTDGSNHLHSPAASDWMLVLKDADETILVRHPIMFGEDNHEQDDVTTAIADLIPYNPLATKIQLLRDEMPVAERLISANAPTAGWATTAPPSMQPGTVLSWVASDADGDELSHTLLYSPDNVNWQPIAMDLPTASFTLTEDLLRDLPGSTAGALRVVVSDGVNTSSADLGIPLQVEDKAPEAIIIGPNGDTRIISGTEIVLEGVGIDTEDGQLPEASLTWESSLDGVLGSGVELDPLVLSDGVHVITLTATDSAGQNHQTSITVVVQPHTLYLPTVQR